MGQYQPFYSCITLCSAAAGEREKKRKEKSEGNEKKKKGKSFSYMFGNKDWGEKEKRKEKNMFIRERNENLGKKVSLEPLKILKSMFVATLFLVEFSLHFPPN